jgi:hypothetical protein
MMWEKGLPSYKKKLVLASTAGLLLTNEKSPPFSHAAAWSVPLLVL